MEAGSYEPSASAQPSRISRKRVLIALAAVVVLVAAGLTTWKLLSGGGTELTYDGKQIVEPGKVLQAGESEVAAAVTSRHGTSGDETRCYYTKPHKQPAGHKHSDVENRLLCGPVLFVDGDTTKPYLSLALRAAPAGSKITLTPNGSLSGEQPAAVPDGTRLVRPDGKSAPSGAGGLHPPQPPPAPKDILAAVALGPTKAPPAVRDAKMVAKDESVTLERAGVVARYGRGDDARAAPDGQRLLAFRVAVGAGDIGNTPVPGALSVSVDGAAGRAVPPTEGADGYVVLAVAPSSRVELILDDGGVKQTLAVPGGERGNDNIAVLLRTHRGVAIGKSASVPVRLSRAGESSNLTFHTTVRSAALDYWLPQYPGSHPAKPSNAMLSVDVAYTDTTAPGKTYGWDAALLKLKLPGGTSVPARNVATKDHVFNVFEVPAGFTSGTLLITGKEKVGDVSLQVSKSAAFLISIPAG
jgi:hypothetical protein